MSYWIEYIRQSNQTTDYLIQSLVINSNMKRKNENRESYYSDQSSDESQEEYEEIGVDDMEEDYDTDLIQRINGTEVLDNTNTEQHDFEILEEEMEKTKDPFYRTQLTKEDTDKLIRPTPDDDYLDEGLQFMPIKVEYDVGYRDTEKYGKSRKAELYLDIFGNTKEGYDVRCKVMGFKPYFYVEITKELFEDENFLFNNALYDKIDLIGIKLIKELEVVVSIEKLVKKSSYIHSYESKYFFKVTCGFPFYVNKLRTILEEGLDIPTFGITKFLTYESNVAFHIRCMIDKRINGCSWIELKKNGFHIVKYKESHCSIEVEVHKDDLTVHKPGTTWYEIAPIRLLSYDIECLGTGDHFPDALLGDKIICISLVVQDTNKKERTSIVLALDETAQFEGCTTYWFDREDDLLMAFKEMMVAINPDLLTGYNISKFDNSYIFKRAASLNIPDFFKLSKIKYKTCNLKISNSYSAQSGSKVSENAIIYGRTSFDMHPIIIGTGFKFNDYTLNTVSREILKDQKNDLHYSHIPRLFSGASEKKDGKTIEFKATPETRSRIASYCEKDSVLPLCLINKIKSIETYVESSRVIGIPIHDLVERGASLRSYAQYLRYCQEFGYLVPVNPCKKENYQGATVIKPKMGYHTDYVSCGDFNSLYPSIMIYINGDPSTYIPPERLKFYKKEEYNEYEVKVLNKNGDYMFTKKHAFIKKEILEGNLCIIEKTLLGERAKVRNEMKGLNKKLSPLVVKKNILGKLDKNDRNEILEEYNKLIKEQEEILKKNSENKSAKNELCDLLVEIEVLQSINEEDYKKRSSMEAEITYIKSYLDILDKRQLALKVCANSLYGWIAASTNSTACVPVSETITSVGRELIEKSKVYVEKVFNIENGYDYDSEIIYGDSVVGDTPILCRNPQVGNSFYTTIEEISDEFITIGDKEYSTTELEVWSDKGFTKIKKVIRHKTTKKIYRISTPTGSVDVTEDHSLLDENAEKIKPSEVDIGTILLHHNLPDLVTHFQKIDAGDAWKWGYMMAYIKRMKQIVLKEDTIVPKEISDCTEEVVDSYLEGYNTGLSGILSGVRFKKKSGHYKNEICDCTFVLSGFIFKKKIDAAIFFSLASSMGYHVLTDLSDSKKYPYGIEFFVGDSGEHSENTDKIIKKELILIDKEQYVYDLETENHHFAAGIGRMIVHNTDSIMIKQKYKMKPTIQKAMDDSKIIVAKTTKYLQDLLGSTVLNMGWEKTYDGMILQKKKKYVGLKYEDGKDGKIDSKGLDDVRRETTRMTKELILKLYIAIFFDHDIKKCKTLIKEAISKLLMRSVSIYDLISSKKLKSEEMYKSRPIHLVLNEKLKQRGSEGYRAGDRVLFVVLAGSKFKYKKTNTKGKVVMSDDKVSDRGEDPLYAHYNNLKLDIDYYLEVQLKKPLTRIFSYVIKDIHKLFEGDHMRHKVDVTPKVFAMSKFVFKVEKCMNCGVVIDMEDLCKGPVCKKCEQEGMLKIKHMEVTEKKLEIKKKEKKCLEECYKCQGFEGDVLCSNVNACANFWVKGGVEKQLKEMEEVISKFKKIEWL
jgi:DNA polymerase elongation subunit (family B)